MAADSPLVRNGVDNPDFLPAVVRDLICSLLGDILLARRFCPPACARTFLIMEGVAAITEKEWRARIDTLNEHLTGQICELCGIRTNNWRRRAFCFFTIPMHREVDILPYNDMVTSMIENAMEQEGRAVAGGRDGHVCRAERLCCFQCRYLAHSYIA